MGFVSQGGAALGQWEQLALAAGAPRAGLALAKAQFWYQAGKPDYARQELVRSLGRDGAYLPALDFLVSLAMESKNADQLKQVSDFIAAARQAPRRAAPKAAGSGQGGSEQPGRQGMAETPAGAA